MRQIRRFQPRDAEALATLFVAYMDELFRRPSAMTADILLRDGQGCHFSVLLAVDRADRPVGFAAWRWDYDLHHPMRGGDIPDLFVARPYRGRALAIRLVAAVARAVREQGGTFIKGEVLADDLKRVRQRMTIGFPGESVYVSGRAFRELADLADADLKTLVAKLPASEASRQP
jgi:GNAT superfamily N-acetyltransferase